jgi:hypothetical protein
MGGRGLTRAASNSSVVFKALRSCRVLSIRMMHGWQASPCCDIAAA